MHACFHTCVGKHTCAQGDAQREALAKIFHRKIKRSKKRTGGGDDDEDSDEDDVSVDEHGAELLLWQVAQRARRL